MTRHHLLAFGPARAFIRLYLACTSVFAWLTFSDDWHAIINDGTAITALSIASGILMAALVISATRTRR